MKEFGSDFHLITEYQSGKVHLPDLYPNSVMMADGRQCIVALIRQEGWHRLWMPEFFCREVVETIKTQIGIEIVFYPDYPLADDKTIVKNLPFKEGDVLIRMNYFGMRDLRSEKDIPVPVIEDHTHDLRGGWAFNSDADWCIASLRKSLPLPEGGMMWSPKGYRMNLNVKLLEDNKEIADIRWEAMRMKSDYLTGKTVEKEMFRRKYVETEDWFDHAGPSLIDERSRKYLNQFDVNAWQGAKKRNWRMLHSLISDKIKILQPEDENCTMFSLILLAESKEQRDEIRRKLIERAVYPAILWQMPETTSGVGQDFSHRMLSIHCDGRYSEDDIRQLAEVVNQVIES